jgi:molybdopterin-synthase adenylyltransferase
MKQPKIKDMHNPMRLPTGAIRIGGAHFGLAAEIEDPEGIVWPILGLMDGSRTRDEIVRDAIAAAPDLDAESVHECVEALVAGGFVEDAGAPPPPELTSAELDHYDRGAYFYAWIDTEPRESRWEIQRRLKQARVTVLGLGGAGSAAAMSLVASGLGAVHCVDFDRVEASNLNRQLLYTQDDIGAPKVERAVDRLRRLNPHVEVTGEERWVSASEDMAALMHGRDLFLLCADRPHPRQLLFWASEAAATTGTPWLMCFYNGPMLAMSTFVPFEVPCYHCVRRYSQEAGIDAEAGEPLWDINVNAVIAPNAALTGHMAALEAIYFLGGLKPQTVGRLFHYNLMVYDHMYFVEAPFWDDCPACGRGRRKRAE